MKDILKTALNSAKIDVQEDVVLRLASFYEMLIEWNEKFNLTRIVSKEDAAVKHFCDSLLALPCVSGRVCDVGSGGGFPSIPLATVLQENEFTLVESNGKKAGFLQEVIDKLGYKNCRVEKARAEDLATFRESFDTVTARAVAALNTLLEYCLPLVKVGGRFLAYKGSNYEEEIDEAQNALKLLGGEIEEIKTFSLPGDSGKRAVIVVKKVFETPKKYPRSQGKPRSKPL